MKSVQMAGRPLIPSKLICIGRNYAAHISELGNETPEEMVVFFKPNAAIGERLSREHSGERVHFEAEICFGIESGRIRYVGLGLDLTKRALQRRLSDKGLPWERCKAFAGSALFGEMVELEGDPGAVSVELDIDGRPAQRGSVKDMIYKPDEIMEELSRFTAFEDGDIVMTGSPAGAGPIPETGRFEGRIRLGDAVVAQAAWAVEGAD